MERSDHKSTRKRLQKLVSDELECIRGSKFNDHFSKLDSAHSELYKVRGELQRERELRFEKGAW